MEGSTSYVITVETGADASSKFVHFSRTRKEDTIRESAPSTRTTTSFPQTFLNCFSFLRPRRSRHQTNTSTTNFSKHKAFIAPTISTVSLNMESSIKADPYSWPHDGNFDPKTTALVIIDMQRDFCDLGGYMAYQGYDISAAREIVPRLQYLLQTFREHGFSIYHTREGHRPDLSTLSSRELVRSKNNDSGRGIGDSGPLGRLLIRGEPGHDIIPELEPLAAENVIDKPGRSAFQHTEFKLMLNIKGIKNLILCGVTTDVCVHSTMRDANDNGFDCVVVEDCTAASEPELHYGAIASIQAEGGIFGAVTKSSHILAAISGVHPELPPDPKLIDGRFPEGGKTALNVDTNKSLFIAKNGDSHQSEPSAAAGLQKENTSQTDLNTTPQWRHV